MTSNKAAEWHHQNTRLIIEELIADGSAPDALYIIEHHCCSHDFDLLEKFCIEAFKLGYEIEEPEEFLSEDNQTTFICDLITEAPLQHQLINEQVTQLLELCSKFQIFYDGWGTYFESGEEEELEEDNLIDNSTLHTLH